MKNSKQTKNVVNNKIEKYVDPYRENPKKKEVVNKGVTKFINTDKRDGLIVDDTEEQFVKSEKEIIEKEGMIGCIIS